MASELLVSATDAEALALLIGNPAAEEEAAHALAEILMDAPLVPDERLPANRVAMHSRVNAASRAAVPCASASSPSRS